MKNENKLTWRRLDNSAKIFPMSTGEKYSTVFRFSVLLQENVNPEILQKAVISALEKYRSFKVKMKAGLFWYYLEQNTKEPVVCEERDYPCKYINPKKNNGYLFNVTYFKNKINIDIFHVLTDGDGGAIFFKEIVYSYLEMCYPNELKQENRLTRKIEYNTEDSYKKNYDKNSKSNASGPRAYELKGKKIKLGEISVIHQIIDLEALKAESKKYEATITQYLTAVLMYSIYKENYIEHKSKNPIKICIPINLKKYFPSRTISNFFSYITVEQKMNKKKNYTFEEIISFVKEQFRSKLTRGRSNENDVF